MHSPDDLFTSIQRLSETLVNASNTRYSRSGFSQHSIVVSIASPDAPDLTLVDLPGIVRTATTGQADSSTATSVARKRSFSQ